MSSTIDRSTEVICQGRIVPAEEITVPAESPAVLSITHQEALCLRRELVLFFSLAFGTTTSTMLDKQIKNILHE
jgi:hypothetical protein